MLRLLKDAAALINYNPFVVIMAWVDRDWVKEQYRKMKDDEEEVSDL